MTEGGSMDNDEKIGLIKECLSDLKTGELTAFSAIMIISHIVDPQELSPEAIEWAKGVFGAKPLGGGGELEISQKHTICTFAVSYEKASWKYVLASMFGYALQPVVLPIMILLSKLLHREIKWFPVKETW